MIEGNVINKLLSFFQLERQPFHITPDPAFIFQSPGHREAMAALVYGVSQRKGFIAITGEVGVGKTTILRWFMEQLDRDKNHVIYLFNPDIPFYRLLRTLLSEFDIQPDTLSTSAMVDQLHAALIKKYRQGLNVVLIFDEAQNIPFKTLEDVRILSNLETSTDKLLQIVFCGQPEFEQRLEKFELRQLHQRIAVRAQIQPLTKTESVDYLRHRLYVAGVHTRVIFTKAAIRLIVNKSRGIPRVINILCNNALITAFGYQNRQVEQRVAKETINDHHRQTSQINRWRLLYATVAVTAIAGGTLLWGVYFKPPLNTHNTIVKTPKQLSTSSNARKVSLVSHHSILNKLIENPRQLVATPVDKPVVAPSHARKAALGTTIAWTEVAQTLPRIDEANSLEAPPSPTGNGIRGTTIPRVTTRTSHKLTKPLTQLNPSEAIKDERDPVTLVVKRGDTLLDLVETVYGGLDPRLVELVQRHNPQVENRNLIHVGEQLVFPVRDLLEVIQPW